MSRALSALMLGLALAWLPAFAVADEAAIRKSLEPRLGGARIEGIQPTPIPGLFEVRFRSAEGPQIVYSDTTGTHVIQGNLIETRAGRDITEERLRKLSAIKFDSLPFEQAVKIQRGNGKRVLAMFSDPYCPYCVKFEKVLQQIDDITVYVFMYPVIRPDFADHSKAVWCSPDKAKAWLDLAMNHRRPAAAPSCETPIEKNLQLGRSLGVSGTPTLYAANGERIPPLAAPQLRQVLDQAAAKR